MKMLKNRKALSPVVAAIILVAVTVAVSLAVAIWMGALTGGFMSSGERVKLGTPYNWQDQSVQVYAVNDGGSTVKIVAARVIGGRSDALIDEFVDLDDVDIPPKSGATITVPITTGTFEPGYEYTIKLITSANNEFSTHGVRP
ncbi:hypothetical protein KEJ32_07630 [Candidatus Bathyarchaeota archaeon]|nr:hypothetical protein [Candidatus Bathyarchaeota archaeon]